MMLWPRRALMAVVRAYRLVLSPWLGGACRFEPTCSVYALGALERHGALAGSTLAVWRIGRCHPLCAGGHDPVPDRPPAFFSAIATRASSLPRAVASPPSDTATP